MDNIALLNSLYFQVIIIMLKESAGVLQASEGQETLYYCEK